MTFSLNGNGVFDCETLNIDLWVFKLNSMDWVCSAMHWLGFDGESLDPTKQIFDFLLSFIYFGPNRECLAPNLLSSQKMLFLFGQQLCKGLFLSIKHPLGCSAQLSVGSSLQAKPFYVTWQTVLLIRWFRIIDFDCLKNPPTEIKGI